MKELDEELLECVIVDVGVGAAEVEVDVDEALLGVRMLSIMKLSVR